jgi:hypothetical protein
MSVTRNNQKHEGLHESNRRMQTSHWYNIPYWNSLQSFIDPGLRSLNWKMTGLGVFICANEYAVARNCRTQQQFEAGPF